MVAEASRNMSQNQTKETDGYEFVNEFYPKNIKRTIHLITQQLKQAMVPIVRQY